MGELMLLTLLKPLNVNPTNPLFDKAKYKAGEKIEVLDVVAKSLADRGYVELPEVEPEFTEQETPKPKAKKKVAKKKRTYKKKVVEDIETK